MSSSIRVRFAPSPTGYLHVGGARTALFNWLLVRREGGKMVLRIEDTDAARNTDQAMQAITDGMRWLGLDWDEGPEVGGDFGPYYQSERKEIYDRYLALLEAAGRVYTEDNGAVRFKFSRQPITIPDLVCGDINFAATEEPDMTVRRPDGGYIFHFCNVVDDLEMGITHVVRGEDHISNTWKHIDLFHAFGKEPPRYGHIPLLLNPDGSKMSKRDEGASVDGYREAGFLPQAVFNYLCLLGWTPKEDQAEIFTVNEAREWFDIGAVHHSNARFDMKKCVWVNQQHLRLLSDEALLAYALPYLEKAGLVVGELSFAAKVLNCVKEKVSLASEFPEWVHFFFREDFPYEDEVKQKLAANAQAATLAQALLDGLTQSEWDEEAIAAALPVVATEQKVKAGALMPLLRFALSGQTRGPDVKVMMILLGKPRVLARLGRLLDEVKAIAAL
ncbi:glutamate--tRNA ligase [Phragmitibacter flavus]|uniref:Glutamate--tRNA ligase n=1 Tax=Phragmitibacter flavus TaxID=2576071 RepID=A0A5R8KC40_9BACT|nr:glutamate--tRNA ligase family protein [Phragmitibacter flavus]TLD69866.1 glutamate--tRNA ligase [Phragmitibacter flavus]